MLIGDDTLIGRHQDQAGWDCTVTIHAWDFEKAGRKSVKTLLSRIYDAAPPAGANITVSGFTLVQIRCEFERRSRKPAVEGPADRYYHGVQRYRVLLEPVPTAIVTSGGWPVVFF